MEFDYRGTSVLLGWYDTTAVPPVEFNMLSDHLLEGLCGMIESRFGYTWSEWRVDDYPCCRFMTSHYPQREIHIFGPSTSHMDEVLMVVMDYSRSHTEKSFNWVRLLWDTAYQQELFEFMQTYLGEGEEEEERSDSP